MSKPNEDRDVYYIPPNFLTSGRLFGGMIRARNAIEACVLVLLTGVPIIKLPFSLTTRIIILCLVSLPLGIFGVIGFEGDSLSEFAVNWVRWLIHRRTLYRSDTPVPEAPEKTMKALSGMSAPKPPEQLGIKIKEKPKKRKKRKPVKKPHKASKHKSTVAKKKQPLRAEDFIPVKDIRNGIIGTTDGRYLRVIEVEPINFLLRNISEQKNIVASFASWMKISPVKVQIKVLTKKADIGKHLNTIEREMEAEDNPKCRNLQLDYYHLIQTIGSREAITRRFLVIFEYEAVTNRKPEYAEIVSALETAVQTARQYFLHCDNAVVAHEDKNIFLMEVLYTIFNRATCEVKPVEKRVRELQAARKDTDISVPVPLKSVLAPESIDLTHGSYVVMDGVYHAYLIVPSDGYNPRVVAGWTSILVNAGEGIDVDFFFSREPKERIQAKLGQQIRINRSRLKDTSDTNTDFDDFESAIRSGYFLKEGLANYEDFYYCNTLVTVTADTLENLEWRISEVRRLMISQDMDIRICRFRQEQALLSILPFCKLDKKLFEASKRNMLTSSAASCYPFTSFEMSDENGILLGVNQHNNSLVIVDIFNSRVYKNANKIKRNSVMTLEFRNQPKGGVLVKKVDAVTNAPISNVEFLVTDSDGNLIGNSNGKFVTDSAGTFTITDIAPGTTLVIKETHAKDGYILDDTPQTVKVKSNEVITVEFRNQPKGGVLVKKVDAATNEPISDVEFLVTDSDGNFIGNANGKFITDSAGTFTITDIAPGTTLIIKETRAKDGYLLDDTPQTVKVKSNEMITLEFRNQPLGGLRIIKLDSVTKKPLEGVQFRITYSDGSFVADEGGKLSSNGLYMTDANGEILIRDIVGTLVVTEVKTIPGYTIDEATRSQTIVVNPDDLQTLIVYNIPAGGLQIIKSDEDTGERLGGVKFEIRKINGEILGTYTTDRDGVISIPNAESGWYTIVERKAKDGYALDTTPVNACVKDSETTTVEITNQRMASIMIHKIDAATGAGIYGVKFVLYDSGKNPIGEYTTDQDGYIYIDDELVPGKYYLRELEAADGYIRDEQYKTVYVERGKCAQIEWENSAVTGQIQIRKYSSEDNTVTGQLAGTPLEGAVFEITQARSGKVVGYIVTDARGVAASGPLPLGRYFVTEVSAPKYYQLSGEKMEAEIEYPSQIIKLSAYNKPATLGVTIKKSGNYEVQHGQTMSYDFSGIANTSNVALNHFFWHDRIPTDATRALSISTGTYNARLYYKVTFKTNLNDYRTLASNLLTSNNYSLSLNAATLRLVQGEYVTDVRFEFGTVPSGFSSVMKPTMRVQVLGTMSNGYQIINRADVGGQYLNEWQTAKTTWVTTVRRFNTTPLPKTGY